MRHIAAVEAKVHRLAGTVPRTLAGAKPPCSATNISTSTIWPRWRGQALVEIEADHQSAITRTLPAPTAA